MFRLPNDHHQNLISYKFCHWEISSSPNAYQQIYFCDSIPHCLFRASYRCLHITQSYRLSNVSQPRDFLHSYPYSASNLILDHQLLIISFILTNLKNWSLFVKRLKTSSILILSFLDNWRLGWFSNISEALSTPSIVGYIVTNQVQNQNR